MLKAQTLKDRSDFDKYVRMRKGVPVIGHSSAGSHEDQSGADLRSYVRSVISNPGNWRTSAWFYGSLAAWIIFTQFSPIGRNAYGSLRSNSSSCVGGFCFSGFFTLAGGVSAALWIAIFAVLALSRHEASRHPNRFVARILATNDILFNAWLAEQLSMAHMVFFTSTVMCAAMLVPGNTVVLAVVASCAIVINQTMSAWFVGRYLETARGHERWIRTSAQYRLDRLNRSMERQRRLATGDHPQRAAKRIDAIMQIRRRLLKDLRPGMRQLEALKTALYTHPILVIFGDAGVKVTVVLAIYDLSVVINAACIAALIVFGFAFMYRLALQLILDIPEASHGRIVQAFRLNAPSLNRNGAATGPD